ncbi:MAG: DUF2933 domain-containing protein [Patescibacteria group bacterium]|nr:DUF2933 domain-containing protein [Patescibacteria group bacterium]
MKINNKLLLVCVGVVLILVFALIGLKILPVSTLTLFIILACPLIHIFMMKDMMGHKNSEEQNNKKNKSCH